MKEVEYTEELQVNSSALSRAVYNEDTRELYVFFHGSNVPAGYKDVSPGDVELFNTAPSQGRYYQQEIKGQFHGVDTGDLVFRKVSPARKVETAPGAFPTPVTPVDSLPRQTYKVTYLHTDYSMVAATSFDEAARKIQDSNDDVTVIGVTIF